MTTTRPERRPGPTAEIGWLERAIGALSPRWAARRTGYRLMARYAQRQLLRYEGADRSERTRGWVTRGGSANATIQDSLSILRERCRDLVRNVPWAKTAVRGITQHVVGHGISAEARVRPAGESDRARREAQNRNAETMELWERWAETPACDADGRRNLYGLQAQAVRTIAEAGEVLVRRRDRRLSDGLPVPVQVQLLEPDHLDASKNQVLRGGGKIVQGVEVDRLGRRVAYWLFPEHPGEQVRSRTGLRGSSLSRRVAADEVLHVFREDRIGQARGVPEGSAAIVKLRDLDDYQDAQLVRQKIAACFVGFVVDANPEDSLPSPSSLVAGSEDTGPGDEEPGRDRFEPGLWRHLPPGQDIRFGEPPGVEGYREFVDVELLAVARAYGVTYELLTGDYSRVNFHSGRLGRLEMMANVVDWRQLCVVPMLCQPIWGWFARAAFVAGSLRSETVPALWTAPGMALTDPGREGRAKRDDVRSGLSSLSRTLRERGLRPRETLEELRDDLQMLDELGLMLDVDGRRPAPGAGMAARDQRQGVEEAVRELLPEVLREIGLDTRRR